MRKSWKSQFNANSIFGASLYLLAFFLTLQTRLIIRPGTLAGGYFEYGSISLYATDLLAILTLFLGLAVGVINLRKGELDKHLKEKKPLIILATLTGMLLALSAVSIAFAQDRTLAAYKLGWLVEGLGIFWILCLAKYDYYKLFLAFIFGLLSQAGLGVWQFVMQSSFSSKWLGIALHKAEELGASVIEVFKPGELPERWLRAYGGLDHPNILGALAALGILLSLYFILTKKKNYSGLFFFSFPILFLALLSSFSRSAWVGFLTGLAIIFSLTIADKNLLRKKAMLEVILIGGIVFFIFFNLYGDLVRVRTSGEGRLEIRSNSERINSDKTALSLIRLKPFFGSGIGNYGLDEFDFLSGRAATNQATSSPAESSTSLNKIYAWDIQPVHNTFLLAAAEIGLAGALIYFALVAMALTRAYTQSQDKLGKRFALAFGAALIVLLSLDHFWFSLHFGVLFFWFFLGFLCQTFKAETA